jgi:hypothetical protein
MTGPRPEYDPALYVQPETFQRLTAQERVTFKVVDGITLAVFPDNDPLYPSASVRISPQVTANAVHRRRWVSSEERYIYEFLGDA